MLLAIDVGNTNSSYGLWDGRAWMSVWRRATRWDETDDELAAWLRSLFQLTEKVWDVEGVIVASVVPPLNDAIARLSDKWLGERAVFLNANDNLGIDIRYDPPSAVGADRIANALGALKKYEPPIIVVDFGTATTFDAVSSDGAYVGGAILPGIEVATQALVSRTAKLPQIEFHPPERAIGKSTSESMQSGVVLGYAGAIEALAERFKKELGGSKSTKVSVVSTGGLGEMFYGLCDCIEAYEPTLTLDGLVVAYERLSKK